MQEYFPDGKFIVMLRDPVERMYSHFHMSKKSKNQNFDAVAHRLVDKFNECAYTNGCLPTPSNSSEMAPCVLSQMEQCATKFDILNPGLYYFSLQRWFKYFNRDQFLIIHYPDFIGDGYSGVVYEIEKFLGVEEIALKQLARNVSPKRDPMTESTRTFLKQFYEKYNSLLYELLGRDFGWD
jgi:hypothetical protein